MDAQYVHIKAVRDEHYYVVIPIISNDYTHFCHLA
jgi:hypothetical protein